MQEAGFFTRTFKRPAAIWAPPEPNPFSLNNQQQVIAHAAWRRGCSVEQIAPGLFILRNSTHTTHFHGRISDRTTPFARAATNDKQATKHLLLRNGLRVPEGRTFPLDQADSAWDYASSLRRPFVTKPFSTNGGKGVTVGIRARPHFDQAWGAAAAYKRNIIVEKMISGADHRIFVIKDHVVAVARRQPASVTGDGYHTIEDLVAKKHRVRKQIPYIGAHDFTLTEGMRYHLSVQGLAADSVPSDGAHVQLHPIANISAGGESEDLTDQTHPSFCEIAVRAVQAIPGLYHAGVDILTDDITAPADNQEWAICEINSNPDTSLHHFPVFGAARDVAGALIESLLPDAEIGKHNNRKSLTLRITGKVQGVGYRHWMRNAANRRALDGWAQNQSDGSVAAALSGHQQAVDDLVTLCHGGPKRAEVEAVESTPLATPPAQGFLVRATTAALA